ncbi:MAG: AGE family epimerase/isomerase [Reyranella sp.]|nr:AGE family epimerase/isomerase [Reyranella sp.]
MLARLEPAAAALVDWAIGAALPLWAAAGFDDNHGRFEERLTLSGERLPDVPLRLMSQARQIHAYALAARRGWHDALPLIDHAYGAMVRDFHRRDGRAGWVFSIRRDGTVVDPCRDLYAHAFVLLAIASYAHATGGRDALALAEETLAFIDSDMAAAQGGGFVEQLPLASSPRRQNPHMHLFEAVLALWECSGDARHLTRAERLFELFADRFFRPEPGVLGEYFTDDLRPAEGLTGAIVEPGHHHEWVWLLRRFEAASGRDVQPFVDALWGHADRHGFDASGMIHSELLADGTPRAGPRRIWPVTEAIKSNLIEARHGRGQGKGRAAELAVLLRQRFLTTDLAGGWRDKLDHEGRCMSKFMPASTLYHLMGAIDELSQSCLASEAGVGALA